MDWTRGVDLWTEFWTEFLGHSGDTLTWSGGGGKGGRPHGWSQLLSAKYKATVSSMDGRGLSTAPLDISGVLSDFSCHSPPI